MHSHVDVDTYRADGSGSPRNGTYKGYIQNGWAELNGCDVKNGGNFNTHTHTHSLSETKHTNLLG